MPIYRQIVDQIRYQIATGALKEGDQVPSVRQLSNALAVNQNTILKVYNQLCAEKALRIERGSGTFVAAGRQNIPVVERKKTVGKLLREAAVQAIHLDVSLEQMKEQLEKEYETIRLMRNKMGAKNNE